MTALRRCGSLRALLVCVCLMSSGWVLADDAGALKEEQFQTIFNGKDLTGWSGDTKHWSVEDGLLICDDKARNLFWDTELTDFVFRFEFRMMPGANSGIGLRAPLGSSRVSREGLEVQLLDDSHERYRKLKPYQYNGSIYFYVPAKRGALRPAGEWNTGEIRCIGRNVQVIINGQTVVDADLDKAQADPAAKDLSRDGIERTRGHLALLGHTSRTEFRNLRVHKADD